MDTYSLLREFADSWMLLALFAFFIGVVIWVMRPGSRGAYQMSQTFPSAMKTRRPRPRAVPRTRSNKMAKKPQDNHEVETTGHEWDGIEEYNNPLPRWWLWVFYATIALGVWYTIAYPAWPMISGATQGYLGYSTRANVQTEIEAAEAANAQINERLASVELASIPGDDELAGYARSAGEAVFNTVRAVPRARGRRVYGISDAVGRRVAVGRLYGGDPHDRYPRDPQ